MDGLDVCGVEGDAETRGPGVRLEGGQVGALLGGKENLSNVGYCDFGTGGRGSSSSEDEAKISFEKLDMKRLKSGVDLLAAKVGLKGLACMMYSSVRGDCCSINLLPFFFST